MGAAGLVIVLAGSAPLQAQHPKVGQRAPDFALTSLSGATVRLSDQIGHPVLINFWASWCAPCRTEMPAIVAADQALQAGGLVVLAVDLRDQERLKDVQKFVAEFAMTFPVLLDERGKVRQQYMVVTVPTTVFVDAAGVIKSIYPGPMPGKELASNLGAIVPGMGTDTVPPSPP